MLNLPLLRNTVVSGLHAKTGRAIIRSDQDGEIPEYPYVAYSITSPYIALSSHEIEELFTWSEYNGTFRFSSAGEVEVTPQGLGNSDATSGGTLGEFDEKLGSRKTKHIEFVFSFTAYAEDEDEAMTLCFQIIEHVTRTGREALQDAGIVVVGTTDVQNRSVLLVEHYERRWGVDVRFRSVDRSVTETEFIETATITNGGG